MKPSAVGVAVPKVGINAALSATPEIDAAPLSYFGRDVVTATVAVAPPATPVTVTTPSEPIATPPLLSTLARHVNAESKFVIGTVKPFDVRVTAPKIGVRADALASTPISAISATWAASVHEVRSAPKVTL